jgi:hypothetical protein
MENISFNFSDIPFQWTLCFNDACPRKAECLRHRAAQVAADEQADEVHEAMCVTPLAWRDGNCSRFFAIRTERVAWGFSHIYDKVLKTHYDDIKGAITRYLNGRSNYYRYRNGDRKLSVKQQQWIENLFRKFGYNDPIRFDHYRNAIVFY